MLPVRIVNLLQELYLVRWNASAAQHSTRALPSRDNHLQDPHKSRLTRNAIVPIAVTALMTTHGHTELGDSGLVMPFYYSGCFGFMLLQCCLLTRLLGSEAVK